MRSFDHRQEIMDTTKEHYFLLFGHLIYFSLSFRISLGSES